MFLSLVTMYWHPQRTTRSYIQSLQLLRGKDVSFRPALQAWTKGSIGVLHQFALGLGQQGHALLYRYRYMYMYMQTTWRSIFETLDIAIVVTTYHSSLNVTAVETSVKLEEYSTP
jgi:hypothetical protein